MDFDSSREERFISKLIRDTKKGEIEWTDQSNNMPVLSGNEKVISKVYTCKISGKNLRIYELQVKHYRDEDIWEWDEIVRLELCDDDGVSLYVFGHYYSLYKLFNAIRKSNSGVDDFMKGFLNE